jgi:hypothetical protein
MFTTIWAKYLPVLRIVLKKSLVSEQMFSLNVPDFERAGLKRKTGYKFLIKLNEGRLKHVIVDSPIASSLSSTLLGDENLKQLLSENEFHISLDSKFQLTIKNIPKHEMKAEQAEIINN